MNHALPPARVIVVEDNRALREELVFQLGHAGFEVRSAGDGAEFDRLRERQACDIVVLDINLPGESGFDIARRVCDRRRLGIVMLTARGDIDDRLRGFDEGADLYLAKPVDRRELVACIASLYRRIGAEPTPSSAGWILDAESRELAAPDGSRLELSVQEASVLAFLVERPGSTRGRDELVRALGFDFMDTPDARTNTVVYRLRLKLSAFSPDLKVLTWRNQGYSFVGPEIRVVGIHVR